MVTEIVDSELTIENNTVRRKIWSHYRRLLIMRAIEEVPFQISSFKDRHMFPPQGPVLLLERQKKIYYLTS